MIWLVDKDSNEREIITRNDIQLTSSIKGIESGIISKDKSKKILMFFEELCSLESEGKLITADDIMKAIDKDWSMDNACLSRLLMSEFRILDSLDEHINRIQNLIIMEKKENFAIFREEYLKCYEWMIVWPYMKTICSSFIEKEALSHKKEAYDNSKVLTLERNTRRHFDRINM